MNRVPSASTYNDEGFDRIRQQTNIRLEGYYYLHGCLTSGEKEEAKNYNNNNKAHTA